MSLVLKITKKYHMVEKRVKKFGQGLPPPLFGQCPKEIDLFYVRSSLRGKGGPLSLCPFPLNPGGRMHQYVLPWYHASLIFSANQLNFSTKNNSI